MRGNYGEDIKVVISHPLGYVLPKKYIDMIQAVSPRLVLEFPEDGQEREEKLSQCEIVFDQRVPSDLERAPRLRWIQRLGEGVDTLMGTPLMKSDIIITNASGVHSLPIAEYVFASILTFSKKIPYLLDLQQKRQWKPAWEIPIDVVRDKTIGIVGYGSIGRCVARIASGFGMRILALKRNPKQKADTGFRLPGVGDPKGELPEQFFSPAQINEVLGQSDFVVLTLPLTPETHHIISEKEMQAMKNSTYLVNIGRGGLINEEALLKALKEKRIAGAGLDVLEAEPLPKESELYSLDNVLLTPHCSWMGGPTDLYLCMLFCENLKRYVAGKNLLNVINKNLNY